MLLAPSAFDRINQANSREAPVGTGAFMYVDEDLDGDYVLDAFPEYWQEGAPRVERLTLSQAVESSQGINGMLTDQFDFRADVAPEDISRLEDAGESLSVKLTNSLGFLYLNPNLEPWGNIHLRQAVNHGIDRDKYVEAVFDGLHTANHWGYLGPALAGIFDEDQILVSFDPDRVREELALAGSPEGFEFDTNILNSPIAIATGEFIQGNLAEFGITMNLVVRPSPDYYIEFFEERADAFIAGMSVRADPWQQLAFLGREDGPYDFILPPGDKDAEVQAAFQKVTEIFDAELRAEAFQELNRVLTDRAWHIHTHYNSSVFGHDPGLQFQHFADGKEHFGQKDVGWAT
jgi:ABC-type transport system substrate-binding protein